MYPIYSVDKNYECILSVTYAVVIDKKLLQDVYWYIKVDYQPFL